MITWMLICTAGKELYYGKPGLFIFFMLVDAIALIAILCRLAVMARRKEEVKSLKKRILATANTIWSLENYLEVIARYQEVCGLTATLRDVYGEGELATKLQRDAYGIYISQLNDMSRRR